MLAAMGESCQMSNSRVGEEDDGEGGHLSGDSMLAMFANGMGVPGEGYVKTEWVA